MAPRMYRAALTELAQLDKSNLESALRHIVRRDAQALGIERVSYWDLRSDHSAIECRVLYTQQDDAFAAGTVLAAADFPRYFEALLGSPAIVAHDARMHPQTSEFVNSYFQPHGITSMLDVPVWRSGRLAGVLCHEHVGPPRAWRIDDQDFAHAVANIVAVTIEAVERQRAEDRCVMLARATNDVLWDWDIATDRVEFSESMANAFRYAPDQVEHTLRWWLDHIHPDDREPVKESVMDAIQHGRTAWSWQYRWHRGDGTLAVVRDRGCIARDRDGRATRMVGSMLDISERVTMEARLALSDRMASIGALAAGVAHEINNPLTYMMWNLSSTIEQLAGSAPDVPDAIELLTEAKDGAERVRRIVRDLQTFSRPREDDIEVLAPESVIEPSISMAWNEIRHRARLIKEYAASPNVQINRARLGQVVLNLLVNAAQAIPEGDIDNHRIRVRTETAADGFAVIEVSDTGCGISPDVRARIFDPFFTTKSVGVGTGLGLSICHSIVTAHGGRIDVDSGPHGGCTVRVALPPAVAELGARTSPPPSVATGTRRRVLVVDDESLVRNVFRRMLEPRHDVVVVDSGERALQHVGSGEHVEVILCDLMMPHMTGMDLYRRLVCEHPALASRVVFLTGGAFTMRANELVANTRRPVLHKPVSMHELYRAIDAIA